MVPLIPLSTYRLQFNRKFQFVDAQALVPYLHRLGITDLYASPLVQARRGSRHGYDVTDPSRLNPELGSESTFDTLGTTLRDHQMGLLLDIVPNHMAASHENPWWFDVLENGPASIYAGYFDIDWRPDPAFSTLENKILLPILGKPYADVLESGLLRLMFDEGGLAVQYYQAKFPLSPRSYAWLIGRWLDTMETRASRKRGSTRTLARFGTAFQQLPDTPASRQEQERRHGKKEALKKMLWQVYCTRPEIRRFVDKRVRDFNSKRSKRGNASVLTGLMDLQVYRLAFWRTGSERINYRRFFDISDLVSLRIENSRVFRARHDLLFRLINERKVTALRVDHVDGLYDPAGYLSKLRAAQGWHKRNRGQGRDFYILVEKILCGEEELPDGWPVAGTTGYDALNRINGLFVDPRGSEALDAIYRRFTGMSEGIDYISYARKKLVMQTVFPGEMRTLTGQLNRLAEGDLQARGLARAELRSALEEVTACLPVYRTYTRTLTVRDDDRRMVVQALTEARRHNAHLSSTVWNFLRRVLLLEESADLTARQTAARLQFLMRWQQFTGPIMAKGFEDTSLYVFNRLVSLNEVGGEPGSCGVSLESFHNFVQQRRVQWPHTMNTTATHDTKRSEDARARINVLSELSDEWDAYLRWWSRWNRAKKRKVEGAFAPDPNEEVLLYQTLLGAWPLERAELKGFSRRIQDYLVKAAREAKTHTRWREVNPEHERALQDFVKQILRKDKDNRFLPSFCRFQRIVAFYGALNSLSQVLLKIALPGVPDFYQGSELWDFRLVDPDNRRPVDFESRQQALRELMAKHEENQPQLLRELLTHWENGRIKLYLTWKALNFRRAQRELFLEGNYLPLKASGRCREHVCAFARRQKKDWALAAVLRLSTQLVAPGELPLDPAIWGRSTLALPPQAPSNWHNVFTGERVAVSRIGRERVLRLSNLFGGLPVALLARDDATG